LSGADAGYALGAVNALSAVSASGTVDASGAVNALLIQVVAGLAAGGIIGFGALRAGWLADRAAAFAAALVGGLIFGFAAWTGALLLLAFFVSSSLLSRLPTAGGEWRARRGRPSARGAAMVGQQGGRESYSADAHGRVAQRRDAQGRTARQVLANGAVAAACAMAVGLLDVTWAKMALAGALAAATADTWATEVGTWWGGEARSAVTGHIVSPGESGGMTPAGTLAAMVGAAGIGFLAWLSWPDIGVQEAFMIEAAGFIGMWVDSALGATVQYKAQCPTCGCIIEEPRHVHAVTGRRGLRFLDNHAVNLAATLTGALAALYLATT